MKRLAYFIAVGLVTAGAIVLLTYFWYRSRAHHEGRSAITSDFQRIYAGLTVYKKLHGHYPQGNTEEIAKSLSEEDPKHPALVWESHDKPMVDPWGTRFSIEINGEMVIIRSAGPDRLFGTTDDIVNQ